MPGIGGYPMDLQEESEWCWAAVALSVAKFFHPQLELEQCRIAAGVTGKACCGDDPSPECNVPERLTDALRKAEELIAAEGLKAALPEPQLRARLTQVVPRPLRFD